jgi:carbonic anhydrase
MQKKISLCFISIFLKFSFAQQVPKDELIKKLIPHIETLNNLFGTTHGIQVDHESWADTEHNIIRINGAMCDYDLKRCQILATHEFIHLIQDNHGPNENHVHLNSRDYYFKTFHLENLDQDAANSQYDALLQLQHSNTNILTIKALLVLKIQISKSDIESYFETLLRYIDSQKVDETIRNHLAFSTQWTLIKNSKVFRGRNRS